MADVNDNMPIPPGAPGVVPPESAPQPVPITQRDVDNFDLEKYAAQQENAMNEARDAKYGSLGQQGIAGLEGLLGGATLNASEALETKMLHVRPEDIEGRAEANPWTHGLANVAGTAGLIAGTGGLAAPEVAAGEVAARTLAQRAAAIGTNAIIGGGINAVSGAVHEFAMNRPVMNAEKLAADFGMGALMGGGFSMLSELGGPAVQKAYSKIYGGPVEGGAPKVSGEAVGPEAPSEAMSGVQTSTLKDLENRVAAGEARGETYELGDKQQLAGAVDRTPMQNPVHPMQMKAFNSAEDQFKYGVAKEQYPVLKNYEALQKNELVGKLRNDINELTPEETTADAYKGGEKSIELFKAKDKARREAAGPLFKQFNDAKINPTSQAELANELTNAVPELSNAIEVKTNPDGSTTVNVKKGGLSSSWGVSNPAYNAFKSAINGVKDLKPDEVNLDVLRNIRNFMAEAYEKTNGVVDYNSPANRQVAAMQSGLMNFIEKKVGEVLPDANVREAYKQWSMLSKDADAARRHLGVNVSESKFEPSYDNVKPEEVNDKIFRNTSSVKAAKRMLGEDFKTVAANWLNENMAKHLDGNKFSSKAFGRFLKNNEDVLNMAFEDNPTALQKIKDYTEIMKKLPDAAPVNPPQTAKTFKGLLPEIMRIIKEGEGSISKTAYHALKSGVIDKYKEAQINAQLTGKASSANMITSLANRAKAITDKIDVGSRMIFNPVSEAAALQVGKKISDKMYNKQVERIDTLNSSPQEMHDHLIQATAPVMDTLPDTANALGSTISTGVQFLASKIPRPFNQLPFSQPWEATPTQKDMFNRYYQTVDDPVSVLKSVRDGTLNNQQMEALSVVHPNLLQEMQQKVMENMDMDKGRNLPYGQKIAIAKFLGNAPIDNSMIPQVLASNQASFQTAAVRQQAKQAAAGGGKPTLGGMKELKVANREATGVQKLENREA